MNLLLFEWPRPFLDDKRKKVLVKEVRKRLKLNISFGEKKIIQTTYQDSLCFHFPKNSRNPVFDATLLLNHVESEPKVFVMMITNQLLINHDKNRFCAGLAQRKRGVALGTTVRLSDSQESLVELILHETGHLLDLDHCEDQNCIMRIGTEDDLKRESVDDYCEDCKRKIS